MIDFSQLDKIIHEKGRLSIMTLLASRAEPWAFQDLKAQLEMSDGNLITHLRTLEKAEFIACEKLTGEGRPQTLYQLTAEGRRAFVHYLGILEQIIGIQSL
jgi:predicted ArsR family transcriptional regulator